MSELPGTFEQAVMLAVVRLGDGAYGRAILQEAQARLDRDVAAGAVYSTLQRLEDKGLLSSRLAAGTAARGGRPRRYYAVTTSGFEALNQARSALDGLWHGLTWPLKGGRS
jgi:PadR family transcriptional regulator PadR